jgi:hypothetical protein
MYWTLFNLSLALHASFKSLLEILSKQSSCLKSNLATKQWSWGFFDILCDHWVRYVCSSFWAIHLAW